MGGVGGLGEKGEGIEKYKLAAMWNTKYSFKNTVKNSVITIYGVR